MAGNTQRKLTIGINALSYLGVNAESPPNTVLLRDQDPTPGDWQNFIIGDIWIHSDQTVTPNIFRVWMLVGLARHQATWVQFINGTGGDVTTLTGNTGGPVPPLLGNINVVGDTTTINVAGNPATNTLTISAVGTGVVQTLTGNSGGPVPPTAGNINVVGDGATINVAGTPGTSTLLVTAIGSGLVQRFVTDNGTAVPAGGIIDLFAQPQAGSSVTFSALPSAATNVIRLNVTDANANTIVGNGAGNGAITGHNNTGLGLTVLHALTSGTLNTCVGSLSGTVLTTGQNNCFYGASAGSSTTTGSDNTLIGTSIGTITTGSNNTALGFSVFISTPGVGLTTGSNNIGIGALAGSNYTGAEASNILIGNIGTVGESNQIKIGTFGTGAGQQNATTLFGGTVSVPNGNLALPTTTSTSGAVTINASRFLHGFGTGNTFVGAGSGNFTLTGTNSIGVGNGTLAALTSGLHNIAIGSLAGASVTSSNDNIFIGAAAGTAATGATNTLVGTSAAGVLTSGGSNVGLGSAVFNGGGGAGLLTGSNNTALGTNAGSAYTGAESGNILVNHTGVVGESNNTRVGVQGTQAKCFIAGIRGVTTDNNDAVAVLISSVGQLGTTSSSQRYKENIQDMNEQSEVIYDLKPKTFNFKKHPDAPAWGLIAEEVDQVFPQLVVYNEEGQPESVRYHELVPLLLNEIQKLNKRIEALEAHG